MEIPHRPPVLVPVRPGLPGSSIRTCRLPDGHRTGVAFTSLDALHRAMGAGHPCVRLSRSTLRAMLAGIGVERLVVDPDLVARPAPSDVRAS